MPEGLYEHDALAWAEHQAALLRRLATGERVNAAIDWDHVIEEVQEVGLSELRACRSLLRQALLHLLKLHVAPGHPSRQHWLTEAATFLDDAQVRFAPSMAQRLDIDEIYQSALRILQQFDIPLQPAQNIPTTCPLSLTMLLDPAIPMATLCAAFNPAPP